MLDNGNTTLSNHKSKNSHYTQADCKKMMDAKLDNVHFDSKGNAKLNNGEYIQHHSTTVGLDGKFISTNTFHHKRDNKSHVTAAEFVGTHQNNKSNGLVTTYDATDKSNISKECQANFETIHQWLIGTEHRALNFLGQSMYSET